MSNQDSTSEFEKALDLMESSSDISDKKWEDLEDVETLDACKDLMDVRFLLHKHQASGMVDVEAELARLKGRRNRKKYLKMFWIWSGSVAAILVGAFFSLNYLFNVPVTSPKSVTVFAADPNEQRIVLELNDGKQFFLDDEPKKENKQVEKRRTLDYTNLAKTSVPVVKKMLQTHSIVIPRGETFKLILCDGTEVWLNANSKLVYPTAFIEKERTVFLEGEAYFKVTKDAKPFIVKTDYLQTKVLGTEFNVKSYTAEDSHVTLISGKVQVRSHENARFVDLEPGKDAMLLSDGLFEVKEVNSEAYTYWKDGYFYFDELPLADIMKSIGRWYNVNVTFRNKEAMAYRIHFMSNRQSGIEETIRLMNRLKKVTLTLCENTVYVD
ncbi:FecR family protein [Bacteroides clarus]|uniref:FecR family protein n=1 Tax=Bacteroides clarus TaxID=626929 RepID=A0A412YKP7_9BACE|nr:FecR family protein [Bacteroides clarus]RGV39029.1 FecR family protein [Bacteroides clarus]RGV57952.1 FecR family protein [Bacteroides clarus]